MIPRKAYQLWQRSWARAAGPRGWRRLAARFAAWKTMPYHCRSFLAELHPRGFVCHTANLVAHPEIRFGSHVFVGDGVFAVQGGGGGPVWLHDRVHLYGNTFIQTGAGGHLTIGANTHVQPGCYFSAFVGGIRIGEKVEIAPECAFYSYDHGVAPGELIMKQPLCSKGGVVVGDGAWLGHGVIVLDGVQVGAGAVVGAGSVVVKDIPDNAIAVGSPARVLKYRSAPA